MSAEQDSHTILFETTLGDFVVETYPDKAPITVENFVNLINDGFYEGIIFHRVIDGFVVQAGGYDSSMNRREPPNSIQNESDNGLLNKQRTLSMALLPNQPNSGTSQFFINLVDNVHLDPTPQGHGYAVFAKVVGGWSVIGKIAGSMTNRRDEPVTPIVINKASVVDRTQVAELLD